MRVYATPGKKKYCQHALDVTLKALPFYERQFAMAYPLSKLDIVAVPDFAAGGEIVVVATFAEYLLDVSTYFFSSNTL